MTAVITVPENLDDRSFESVIDQVAQHPADAQLLVDARHTTFGTPYAITSLLCLAQSRVAKPSFAIPETSGTASYWARAGFFHYAGDLYELRGKAPSTRATSESDYWLPITPIAGSEDVHSVVERIQERAEAILVNELESDPRMIGRFAMTLSEACQNIVEHAGRSGWVTVQSYSWARTIGRRVVQIAVCDAGVGFTASLAPTHARHFAERWSDGRALEESVLKGRSRFTDPGRGQGFAGIKRFLAQWQGKLTVRSGTARIAVIPTWDSDVPLREGLSSFPGAQVLITIPGETDVIPMVHIDVAAILQGSVKSVYTDLVTRATGRTVRTRIEEEIEHGNAGAVAVIDFSKVGLLDFSCADEIVATLMRKCCADIPSADRYLLFAGISDAHLDAIEHVLERHRMALVVRITGRGTYRLVGMVDEGERIVWEAVVREQPADSAAIAYATGFAEEVVRSRLATLHRRRLVMREGSAYRAPTGAVA